MFIHAEIELSVKNEGKRDWNPIIVKVTTDDGTYGLGEVGLAYGNAGRAGFGIVRDFAKHIIGMDAMNTEAIWNKLMNKTFWGQGGGTVIFAGMSAIDIALWDIKGKALGVPIYQLLGGKCREELRCYASQLQFDWGEHWRPLVHKEEYAEAALRAMDEGYNAVKVDFLEFDYQGNLKHLNLRGPQPNWVMKMGIERLEAIRKACGDDLDIIIENHGETDTTSAIQFGRLAEPYNIMYYEEVNTPLNPDMHKYVKDKINIPLAGGERIYSRWGYLPFFHARSLDIIQPDLGTCGGLSEAKKICDMAHAYDMTVQTHICASPILKAASLHLEAAIPNFCIHEHHRIALIQGNVELCTNNYQPVKGKFEIPDLPGLGQDLTPKAYALAETITID